MSDTAAIADPHVKERVENSRVVLDFNVQAIEDVVLIGSPDLTQRDLMSPYVWAEPDGRFGLMVRAVPAPDQPKTDTGMIWAGWGDDGRHFTMLPDPVIVPGPDDQDAGGIEDPTVLRTDDGYVVYYTGVMADMSSGNLCYASGPSVDRLTKSGIAMRSSKSQGNTKEATIDRTPDGQWRLFYEYAADEASRIGVATSANYDGPWEEQPTPFMPRDDSWDNWHLSTGPMLMDDPDMPIMFYNGATHDARWRIGWIAFSRDILTVVDRGIEPMITPPPVDDRTATDIAFAASVIKQGEDIWLYYSLEDRRLARARIRKS